MNKKGSVVFSVLYYMVILLLIILLFMFYLKHREQSLVYNEMVNAAMSTEETVDLENRKTFVNKTDE